MRIADPYTHAQHAARCRAAAMQNQVLSRQLVQVRKRGVVYCAQLVEAYTTPDGHDCWTVDAQIPESARFTVSSRNVRLCGQKDCCCIPQAMPAGGAPLRGEEPAGIAAAGAVATSFLLDFDAGRTGCFSQAGVVAPPESLTHEISPVSARS